MRLKLTKVPLASVSSEMLVLPLPVTKDEAEQNGTFAKTLSPPSLRDFDTLDKYCRGDLRRQVRHFDYAPGKDKRITLSTARRTGPGFIQSVHLCGMSADASQNSDSSLEEWRKLGGSTYQKAKGLRAKSVAISLASLPKRRERDALSAMIEGMELARYEYSKYKSKPEKAKKSTSKNIQVLFTGSKLTEKELRAAEARALAVARAVFFARDLVNCPPSDLKPADLVRAARSLSRQSRNGRLSCRVLTKAQLRRMGAGAILAVGQASTADPFLIHLSYIPRKRAKRPKRIVLIGKGITFDSGGLSIKPATGMEEMKCDMAGAAAVLGVGKALTELPAEQAIAHEVHIIVPTAENMVSGNSVRPGDVVRALNGKTIEVLNTDAEGRLILADALSYSARLKADVIIDLATLTGACVVALGNAYAGLFTKSEELALKLKSIGLSKGERLWPLPLADEYRTQIESKIANLKNIGSGGPGATIGALFLQEFVPNGALWAHVDIAGPAFTKEVSDYKIAGASGFGVQTLLGYLQSLP